MPLFQKNLFQNDAYDTGAVIPVGVGFADSAIGLEGFNVTAFIALVDDAVGGDALLLGDQFPSYPGDDATGGDELAVTAFISLYDSAVGSDVLLKSFLLPPIVDYPPFNIRDLWAEKPPVVNPSQDDATGGETLNVFASSAFADAGEGKDSVTVDKQYPQLEAFHWLLAA